MATLLLHGGGVDTVFDLLGRGENDMTFALGWGLTHSDPLLAGLLRTLELDGAASEDMVVRLQQYEAARGFTDIELSVGTSLHVIVEAKRGWWLPSREQLALYAERFSASGAEVARLVVLTQWGAESAARHAIARMSLPYRCDVLGWSDVLGLVWQARRSSRGAARHWLDQLGQYLREVTDMRDTNSNNVYVVSLGHQRPHGWPYDFLEVVTTSDATSSQRAAGTGRRCPRTTLPFGTTASSSRSTTSTTTSSPPTWPSSCRCRRRPGSRTSC